MGNIDTYVKDIGKKTFAEEPFNDVDNLIVSYLVYYDFRKIVPTPALKQSVTVAEAAKAYKEMIGDTQSTVRSELLQDMGASVRFSQVLLTDRIDIFHKSGTQFSALCVILPDKTPYFVFRGVDATITGWREAFETSYRDTPAQKMSADYVRRIIRERVGSGSGKILFGGHSKGGNLALYAAVHLDKEYRDRVERIYQNDSPGLRPGSFDRDILHEYEGRIRRIVPEFSLVDSVFRTTEPTRVVKVDAEGFVQHEPYFWVVEGKDFVNGVPDPEALKFQRMLKKWITSMKPEESRSFVHRFFGILQHKIDEGRPLDPSKAGAVVGLIFESWAGSERPAKRAMLRLAEAAWDAAVVPKFRRNSKKEEQ